MAAVYPANVRSFTTHTDLVETVFALHMNDAQDEITAIQNVLGANPQGAATGPATVGKRMVDLETGKASVTHDHTNRLDIPAHDVPVRHTFGASAALGTPDLPAPIVVGAAGSAGAGDNPAKEDHSHPVPSALALGATFLPPGMIVAYGGTTAPAGWVLCDGASYTRGTTSADTYFNLFQAIGTGYGSGSGTTFNVPDLRNKFPMGRATPTTAVVAGGSRNATLVSHSHTVNLHSHGGGTGWQSADHAHGGTTDWMDRAASHDHDEYHDHYAKVADNNSASDVQGWPAGNAHGQLRSSNRAGYGGVWGLIGGNPMRTDSQNINHLHGFSTGGSNANHTHSIGGESPGTDLQGSSATDANLPPYQTVNFIIKL
jgi:microcystin-dependent protein